MPPGPPPGPLRALVGVAEVADLLGVSRQRADVLTRTKGFPDPITAVLVVDELADERLAQIFGDSQSIDLAGAMAFLHLGGHRLPDTPRLWRREVIVEWAKAAGRELHDTDTLQRIDDTLRQTPPTTPRKRARKG